MKVFDSFVEFVQKNACQADGGPGGGVGRLQGKCLAIKLQRVVILSLTQTKLENNLTETFLCSN